MKKRKLSNINLVEDVLKRMINPQLITFSSNDDINNTTFFDGDVLDANSIKQIIQATVARILGDVPETSDTLEELTDKLKQTDNTITDLNELLDTQVLSILNKLTDVELEVERIAEYKTKIDELEERIKDIEHRGTN